MRKKLVVLAMVALVALVTVTPALASANGVNDGSNQQVFSVLGTIVAIDGDTFRVRVSEGSRLVWPYIGQELTVQMTPATLYYHWTPDGLVSIRFGDVEVDDRTNIHGTVADDGVFTAGRVIVSP
jgi:hypothetical protein